MTIDMETLRGLGTLFLMTAFLALCVWAYWPAKRRRFEEDALLPFREDELERGGGTRNEYGLELVGHHPHAARHLRDARGCSCGRARRVGEPGPRETLGRRLRRHPGAEHAVAALVARPLHRHDPVRARLPGALSRPRQLPRAPRLDVERAVRSARPRSGSADSGRSTPRFAAYADRRAGARSRPPSRSARACSPTIAPPVTAPTRAAASDIPNLTDADLEVGRNARAHREVHPRRPRRHDAAVHRRGRRGELPARGRRTCRA